LKANRKNAEVVAVISGVGMLVPKWATQPIHAGRRKRFRPDEEK
jgi:hypothetical protein